MIQIYRCPHCGGNGRKLKTADIVVCEGEVHCQFSGPPEEFEITEVEEIIHGDDE